MTNDARAIATSVLDEVERAVIGKRDVLELVLIGLMTRGHVLLEDRPGTAKTLLATSFATALGLDMTRVQFTPDLLPSDITGSTVYDPSTQSFRQHRGPVFTNILLGDEINRAPPKTQAALLEAMAEQQVTLDGQTEQLPDPFLVIATQNPIDVEGTYPLPEAQLDRFRMQLSLGYPDRDDEWEILRRRVERREDLVTLNSVASVQDVAILQGSVEDVHVDPTIGHYVVDLTRRSRDAKGVRVGSSPRGALSMLATSRAHAVLRGRDHVTPDDVKHVAAACLSHRLVLDTDLWVRGVSSGEVVARLLDEVPTPPTIA